MEKYTFTVTQENKGQRIDKLIPSFDQEWTRSQIQTWIKEENIQVNGESVKGNYKVSEDDEIVVMVPEPETLEVVPEDLNLDIVYEDQDVLVVNKPRGMVVHPAPGHPNGTLVNGLMHQVKDLSGINGVIRPGIVHRIDKDTSGLLMVAKNDNAHESLVKQLQAKTVNRRYKAIVHGNIQHDVGTIDAPIGRDKQERQRMTVTDEQSRDAVTHFKVLERYDHYTYVECQLETGRTHQIRVHMKYIDHPVAGDPKYGPRKKSLPIDGQALHAGVLGFEHPVSGEWLEFSREVPEDMEQLLKRLRR
ncbi:RluA family pseudouridine synthase [Guptibacillus algicola]|uniref:RluA family pseudouridine synthase n=1 Tax=Guptibacillus algicola TaxID=225844 RepID=UPI001CD2F5B5|nr:RluA family pseudouridine synthase [Alkalihalobacillus algicola]MCA0988001.1 RluA family pseudouridine synthase [Alkalihalobacillus algicola]